MLMSLFKRRKQPAPTKQPAPAVPLAPTKSTAAPLLHEPLPVPEVREDHDESAWDMWEQSQFQLDSQLGSLSPGNSVRLREPGPSEISELDPFSRVGKNDR